LKLILGLFMWFTGCFEFLWEILWLSPCGIDKRSYICHR